MTVHHLEMESLVGSPDGRAHHSPNGRSSKSPSDSPRRQSKFPRNGRLKVIFCSVVGLSAIVFTFSLVESWRIPLIASLGIDVVKDGVKEGDRPDQTPSPGSHDSHDGLESPQPGVKPAPSLRIPTESPSLSPTQEPTPLSHSGDTDPSNQLPSTATSESAQPTDKELTSTDRPAIGPNKETLNPTSSPIIPNKPVDPLENFTYPEVVVPDMSNASQAFVDRWCDLTGTDWYPRGDSSWKLRAPAFLIPGAKYSGINAVTALLGEHPQIRPPSKGPETQFFFDKTFQRYVKANEKVTVMQARERLLALNYPALDFQKSPATISYDASSGYLFRSNVLPRRLMCVLPWIKIVVVLRDPIERLYDHYVSLKASHNLPFDLEDWIESDMKLMRSAGLIGNSTAPKKKLKNKEEDTAWWEYQQNAGEGPVGRSLYAIQLRHWFQTLLAVGRVPKDCVLIVRTEQLAQNPDKEFRRILDFLNLSDFTPSSWDVVSSLQTKKSDELTGDTQKLLKDFFQPYDERLEKLLRKYDIPNGLRTESDKTKGS